MTMLGRGCYVIDMALGRCLPGGRQGKLMKLKNILVVVDDVERSKKFYHDLFGLEVVKDFGGNVILTEGLVLQERTAWEALTGRKTVRGDGDAELYFEENDLDFFLEKAEGYPEPVRYLNPPGTGQDAGGRRVVRLYDPDGHMIEVAEPHNAKNRL